MDSGSQQLPSLVKWINAVLPNFNLPLDTSEDELRARLRDGSLLCSILDNLVPGSVKVGVSLVLLYTCVMFFLFVCVFLMFNSLCFLMCRQ